jgi:hypothetical protein
MTKQLFRITAGLTLAAAGLWGQTGAGYGTGVGGGRSGVGYGMPVEFQQFQQAGTIGVASGRAGVTMVRINSGALTVIGRPVSATEERKSEQTLGDGTEISTSDSNLFYRDSQGRTRAEQVSQGRTVIEIMDPVARFSVNLNPAAKTARRTPFPGNADQGAVSVAGRGVSAVYSTMPGRVLEYNDMSGVQPGTVTSTSTITTTTLAGTSTATTTVATGGRAGGGRGGRGGANNTLFEDLGVQSQNGVLATGTRNTLTIPQGQIGNNRDIHVVNERWYSEDLQMLVKTVNSDPRFGENTYQLTNVSRTEPDPALFQIPPDYTILDTPVGGRGRGAPAVAVPVVK